jgi:hypothetical protein
MKKWIAVAAVLAFSATGALAQRGMGRGAGQAPAAGARGPAAPRMEKANRPAKVPKAPQQPRTVQFNETQKARLQPMLPVDMPIEAAAEGFKNRGQFIAALQVSKNLGIPFEDLKLRMTGPEPQSLGRAIQDLRPAMTSDEAKLAVRTAEQQARDQERDMARQERQARERQREQTTPEAVQPQ